MNVSYVSFFAMFLMYLLAALFGYLTFYGEYCLLCFLLNDLNKTTVFLCWSKQTFTMGSKYTQLGFFLKYFYMCTPRSRSVVELGPRHRIKIWVKQVVLVLNWDMLTGTVEAFNSSCCNGKICLGVRAEVVVWKVCWLHLIKILFSI